jgi:metalloendopeptidase OMA1, mitochondrial
MPGRIIALVALLALGCAKVPYTNRSQLILVSQRDENALGAQAFTQVVAKSRIDQSPALNRDVVEVGERLARVANRPDFQWKFVVIDDPKQVNAFCLPGGKVAIYTGILPVAQDQAGLAVVLGHEIAHALARHGAERMSQGMVAQSVGQALAISLGGGAESAMILAAYGLGAQYGVLLPYGRTQESEADHIGLLLMAQAGYDPRVAVEFWQRMERSGGGGGTPEFLSTHPGHGTRVKQLSEWMPEATRLYDATPHAPNARLAFAGAATR